MRRRPQSRATCRRCRWQSLSHLGSVVALGSDGEPRSPFVGMYFALSFPFEPQLSREALVRWYTAGSAYAESEEQDKRSLFAACSPI